MIDLFWSCLVSAPVPFGAFQDSEQKNISDLKEA
jgi:hypothetical protein